MAEASTPSVAADSGVARKRSRAALALAIGALSLVGGLFPSFSVAATAYVLALSAGLAALGLSGRVPRHAGPGRLHRPAGWWLVPVLAAGLLELVDFLLGSTRAHPTVSGLMDPVLAGYLPRCAGYAGWLSAFWCLVRR